MTTEKLHEAACPKLHEPALYSAVFVRMPLTQPVKRSKACAEHRQLAFVVNERHLFMNYIAPIPRKNHTSDPVGSSGPAQPLPPTNTSPVKRPVRPVMAAGCCGGFTNCFDIWFRICPAWRAEVLFSGRTGVAAGCVEYCGSAGRGPAAAGHRSGCQPIRIDPRLVSAGS